ncbi:MAG: DeoR/GlpR family DNA-binding transcription regulator [Cellulosilyticaceae bacterium]
MDTRQNQIIEILRIKKNVSIDYLCQSLSYSTSTIRRDVITLQEMGLVKREKGNVRLLVTSSKEKHFKIRAKENIDKKRVICGLAKDFITDGMSIFLDASSTVLQLVPILAEYKNITVVTNGIEIAHALIQIPDIEIFMSGGYVREGSSAIVGEPAIDYIKQFNLDLCILSCNGVDKKGFYEPSMQQSIVKKYMMKQAEMTIMICDSTKVGNKYKFTLAEYNEIDYFITDKKPIAEIYETAAEANCEMIYADKGIGSIQGGV